MSTDVLYGILGIAPIFVYLILVMWYKDPVPVTIFCVALLAVFTHQTLFSFGDVLAKSMGSFLTLVGLIIMMGRGLGEVLNATKVSHTLVHKIVHAIGVNTESKAMMGILATTVVICGLLGTLSGGIAVIAPIVVPVAAAAGLTRSTVGVLFQAGGEEGLSLGPLCPPVIVVLSLAGVTYLELLKVTIPIAIVTFLATWFMARHIQKVTKGVNDYDEIKDIEQFTPDASSGKATVAFLLAFIMFIVAGLIYKGQTSYIPVVMLGLSLITGLAGGMKIKSISQTFIKGMAGNLHLFMLFLFFDPFMFYLDKAGAFAAAVGLIQPLINYGGSTMVPVLGGLTGTLGVPGATVAVLKMVNDIFQPLVMANGVPILLWTFALVVASRTTNFFHPGSNMFGSMGFAQSEDLMSMIKNGWVVTGVQLLVLCVISVIVMW